MSRPPLGREVPIVDRTCTRDVEWPNEVLCGGEAFLHVAWEWGDEGAASFVCERHTAELTQRGWRPVQQHEVGPDCGMPNAVWDEIENRCYVPEDEAAVTSTVETVTSVGAGGGDQ